MARRQADDPSSLIVMSGHHRGARIPLGGDRVVIGGTAECTARLSDAEAQDCAIEVGRDTRGRLEAACLSGTCTIGNRALKPGDARSVRSGQSVDIGPVRLAPGNSPEAAQARLDAAGRRGRYAIWGTGMALIVATTGFVDMPGGRAAPEIAQLPAGQSTSRQVRPVERAREALRRQMDAAGFAALDLRITPDGTRLLAEGEAPPQARGDWEEIVRWFDGMYGARVMLESDVRFETAGVVLPFDIRSIAMHPRARVVLHDGSAHGLGAVLPGGWRVEEIHAGAVELSRGENVLTLSF